MIARVMSTAPRRTGFALFLLITGVAGWIGAFMLTIERFHKLIDPDYTLSCSVNVFVDCGPVMSSWQGSLFGFPNPVIGVAAFVAPIAVGLAMLAGARFARWFWMLFTAGVAAGWVFVMWLFTQAVYEIGTLCPWCMLVWLAHIPLFWQLVFWGVKEGHLPAPAGVRRGIRSAFAYLWIVPALNLAVIAIAILVQFPRLLPSLLG